MATETKKSLIERAIAGGITQSQIDMLFEVYPVMATDAWWLHNAATDPVRAIRYRLSKIDQDSFKRRAAKWSDEILLAVVAEHRLGVPVDTDKLAEATARGLISASESMNSDF